MTIIDLSIAKQHLRVEGADDDAIIGVYLGAAEEAAASFLGRLIYIDEEAIPVNSTGIAITFAIKAAVLLTLGHLYANRENVVIGTISSRLPFGALSLLEPYRIGLGV